MKILIVEPHKHPRRAEIPQLLGAQLQHCPVKGEEAVRLILHVGDLRIDRGAETRAHQRRQFRAVGLPQGGDKGLPGLILAVAVGLFPVEAMLQT